MARLNAGGNPAGEGLENGPGKVSLAGLKLPGNDDAGSGKSGGGGRGRFVIKPSKTSCIVLGSLTGLVVAGATGLYFWQSGQIDALSQQVKAKQTQVANSEKISRELRTVTETNAQTRADLQHLETSVTEGHYIPTLLHQTEDLARATNLHVGALRPTLEAAPTPPPDKEAAKRFVAQPYDKEQIDMDLSGHYWDFAQLLYKLTVFPKIMMVENVTMAPANTGPNDDHSKLNVKLRLTGFIFKNDAAAAAVAAPGMTSVDGAITPSAPGVPMSPVAPTTNGVPTIVAPATVAPTIVAPSNTTTAAPKAPGAIPPPPAAMKS